MSDAVTVTERTTRAHCLYFGGSFAIFDGRTAKAFVVAHHTFYV